MAVLKSEYLQQEVRSFVLPSKSTGGSGNVVERTKSAIVLMRCLPCARAAVLEQLCEIFQEAVHKHIIEKDRQDLLGSGDKVFVDPEINEVIQNICKTLLAFVDDNSEAWAPIITKWSVNLLGQMSVKYAAQLGIKGNTISLNQKLQTWLTYPAAQVLIEISAQCFSKLINTNLEVCIQYLIDSAVQHSPHFDWVVAYIGSYFYKSIIDHLMLCAVKEFHSDGPYDDEFSNLFKTAKRLLDYFAEKYPTHVRDTVLAMFKGSVDDGKFNKEKWGKNQQGCLIPFFVHLATSTTHMVNGTIMSLLDYITSDVILKLRQQLFDWSCTPGNHTPSLLSSFITLIISLKRGTFKTLQYLLNVSSQDSAERVVGQYAAIVMEKVLMHLQRMVIKKHRAEYLDVKPTSTSSSSGKDTNQDVPFLNDLMKNWKDICDDLLKSNGQRLFWNYRLLSIVAIYSGPTVCAQIFDYIITFKQSSQNLSLYVELQREVQAFYPNTPNMAVTKCLKRISIKSSRDILNEVQTVVENFYLLLTMEKTVGQEYSGFSVGRLLRHHTVLLVSLLPYPKLEISSVILDILITIGFPFITFSVGDKMKITKTTVSLFFKLLHHYSSAFETQANESRHLCIDLLKRYQVFLLTLCRDEPCQILAVRHFVEGLFCMDNKTLFFKRTPDSEDNVERLLLEKNTTPGISSRLPLNTASVFYLGVIGKGKKSSERGEIVQTCAQSNSQLFLQCIHTVCLANRPPGGIEQHNVKIFANLAILLRDHMIVDGCYDWSSWPDDDMMKYSIERDVTLRKQFNESEIFWHLLFFLAEVPHVLLNCLPLIHGLFSSILKFWEQCRELNTRECESQLHASVQMMEVFRKAMWLPTPLCFIGDIFNIITPKEVHQLLLTIWEFLKENPPTLNTRIVTELPDGRHSNIIKSIFLKNIAELGHLYARFFPVKDEK